jgi:hypothetical protein
MNYSLNFPYITVNQILNSEWPNPGFPASTRVRCMPIQSSTNKIHEYNEKNKISK